LRGVPAGVVAWRARLGPEANVMGTGLSLTLPSAKNLSDAETLPFDDALRALVAYDEENPAALALYDGTNTGPHNEVTKLDVLSINALNASPWPATAMTDLWGRRGEISSAVSAVTREDIGALPDEELGEQLHRVADALIVAQGGKNSEAYAKAAKLLHRLRPNIVPLYDNEVWGVYANAGLENDPTWHAWLRQVYSDVRSPRNAECLAALRDEFSTRLSALPDKSHARPTVLRIWDIILWRKARSHPWPGRRPR
jgi:hypothetical protein